MKEKIKKINNWIKKNYHWFAPLIISIIPVVIWALYSKDFGIILVQIFILIAVSWYSFETRALRISGVELEQKPIVGLYLRGPDDKTPEEHFALRNIGKGVAYDVEVEDVEIDGFKYKFHFDQANSILAPIKDEKLLKMITYYPDGGIIMHKMDNFKNHFCPPTLKIESLKNKFTPFLIKYKNIVGEKYYSLFKFYSRHPLTEEFTIEFIENQKGNIDKESACQLCEKALQRKTIYEERIIRKDKK